MKRFIQSRRVWNLMDIRRRPPVLNRLRGVLQFAQQPGALSRHRQGGDYNCSMRVSIYSRPGKVSRLNNADATWHNRSRKEKPPDFDPSAFRRRYRDS
uniref:mt-LAF27 n=1 Tax=Trypanosoma brucei brucei TaxID=5702 RepID=UPI00178D0749|nr:Chain E7, mt-LAF27 [Trypanosoma brucei brucei]